MAISFPASETRAIASSVRNKHHYQGSSNLELPFSEEFMNIPEALKEKGFFRVCVLRGEECGITDKRLILCFMACNGAKDDPEERDAVIHPYYPVSQQCFLFAKDFVQKCRETGLSLRMENRLPLKPILARLSFVRVGVNTLSFCEGAGSYFHIQCFASDEDLPVTDKLSSEPLNRSCDGCGKCIHACPTGAIRENGFDRERCVRYWMLNGTVPPPSIADAMGNRLLGCDYCQACCPLNEGVTDRKKISFPLNSLLDGTGKETLSTLIGRNMTGNTRLLIQACILAGNTGRTDLTEYLEKLSEHPSEAVREAALAARNRLP